MSYKEITSQEAEQINGKKLDKRCKYAISLGGDPPYKKGQLLQLGSWYSTCSGCYESVDGQPFGDYPWHEKHGIYIGAGCSECGYHGIVKQSMYLPYIDPKDLD